jgi:acetylornithine/succinyldiaminopimelate/putrescine aminotransferase
MASHQHQFLQYIGQTSDFPLLIEIERAEGIYMFDPKGKQYMDIVSGVCVNNLGHNHPKVVQAVKSQIDKYMHLHVYGEFIQSSQVMLAKLLADSLPSALSTTYFVNSGSEAIEGAMKLSKRYTGRSELIAFKNAYHGSTHGALSILGNEYFKNSFRPLLPDVRFLEFNNPGNLDLISDKTACVVAEPIQAEAGVILPQDNFLRLLRERCTETGALLVFDEVQTGFGRTGSLFAFEKYNILPDIIVLAKGLGGGLPLGAFISSSEIISFLKTNPTFGHITTFGGHPVSCASAYASLRAILDEKIIKDVQKKGELFRKYLIHQEIKEIRGIGLLLAIELRNSEQIQKVITLALEQGIVLDGFLFNNRSFRISPPLIINDSEIKKASEILIKVIEESSK